MKRWLADFGGGPAGLRQEQASEPEPARGQVLVRVRAVSLNFRELSVLRGRYPLPVKPTFVPVSDGAGDVVAVGDAVDQVRVGDRVIGVVFPQWRDGPFRFERAAQLGGSLDGMLTEYAVLEAQAVLPFPQHLTYQEASTLPCAAVTAWHALTAGRPPKRGGSVLSLTAGAVSLFAVQLARSTGLRVIATTGSNEKAETLRRAGASDVVVARGGVDVAAAVRALTDGAGVDRVVHVGNDLNTSLRALAPGGEVSLVGMLGLTPDPVDPALVFAAGATLRGIALGSRRHTVEMLRVVRQGELRPVIDRVFEFDEAAEAFAYYQASQAPGKVVIASP